jgi:hypothetical protein
MALRPCLSTGLPLSFVDFKARLKTKGLTVKPSLKDVPSTKLLLGGKGSENPRAVLLTFGGLAILVTTCVTVDP